MTSADNNEYFIIHAKPPSSHGYLNVGEICFISKERYDALKKRNDTNIVPIICMGSMLDSHLNASLLHPLTRRSAELLLALETNEERIIALKDPEALQNALDLSEGSQVYVEHNGQLLKGVIRYIGSITSPSFHFQHSCPIVGVFFGVELLGEDKGKGLNEGSYHFKTYFNCSKNSGIFAPFTRVKPMDPKPLVPLSKTSTEPLMVGDRVTFIDEREYVHHGMVMNINDKKMVLISTDRDEDGKQGGEITVPLDCVIKEELLNKVEKKSCGFGLECHEDECEKMDTSQGPEMGNVTDSAEITVGSLVQVILGKGPAYGTVRWIGFLPDFPEMRAGLELEDACGVNDGTFKKKRYFSCPPKCGLFVKLASCQPDDRFSGAKEKVFNGHSDHDEALASLEQENVPPVRSEDVSKRLVGRMKGIQGHCNSCYMDSALFSLFSCSSVLDSLLFKSIQRADHPIQSTLLKDIVNPLRREGFVPERSVMKLRQLLQKRGHCPTYTTDEKDPEEFLSLIMQEVLSLDPPLKLRSQLGNKKDQGKVQSCYFYQIFMDYNHPLVLPTVQQLLEHSFHSNSLKLSEVPACLILTMPRSGKSFKMFPKIIPSTELDITSLLSDGPQQCVLCGQLANEECADCFRDQVFSDTGFKYFCVKCSAQVHSHQERRCHKPSSLHLPQGYTYSQSSGSDTRTPPREKLELFAVLCIETSHYVSFVKYGPQDTDWIFFDSMADRIGEKDGYNIPEVQACPEVGKYLHMPLAQLANQCRPTEVWTLQDS
ncbi:ubiquitin carboxyl-terminal hydrolase CYLD isoform X3 [Myxocyprinus asiaticus]|uniref:ubiquitin carboxyl-terminal hydrolase CYLD isoform X3 n=1 Tax=Myxocyprinus asiaticus TaxID=70543 RepID=UPI002223D6B1|nr:ubiquitin carboxyl-terminal hydrolase CYLD isoform X3 [Myxocyprinus asiaticus]